MLKLKKRKLVVVVNFVVVAVVAIHLNLGQNRASNNGDITEFVWVG